MTKEKFSTKLDDARSLMRAEVATPDGDIMIEITHPNGEEGCRYLDLKEAAALRDWLNKVLS